MRSSTRNDPTEEAPTRRVPAAVARTGAATFVAVMLAAFVVPLAACKDDRGGKLDEAVEEIKDEAEDAKEEVEDEIDDHM